MTGTNQATSIIHEDKRAQHDEPAVSLAQRIATEWMDTSYFNLMEPNGRALHVQHTFTRFTQGQEPHQQGWLAPSFMTYRVSTFVGTLTYFLWAWFVHYQSRLNRLIYMAYFTRWNILLIILYQGSMVILTLWPNHFLRQPSGHPPAKDSKMNQEAGQEVSPLVLLPHPLVQFAWILHSSIVPFQFIVIPVYWVLSGTQERHYETANMIRALFDHGIISILFLLDGMILCRIPIRLRHAALSYAIFISWVVVYLVYDLTTTTGNGSHDWEPEDDVSSLYRFGWDKDGWYLTFGLFAAMILVYLPAAYSVCWCISLLNHQKTTVGSTRLCCSYGWSLDGSHRPTVDVLKVWDSTASSMDRTLFLESTQSFDASCDVRLPQPGTFSFEEEQQLSTLETQKRERPLPVVHEV